jgi:flavodoxin/NAD-dependent dihydropyrimidine dehydrogenase PreA subunit
MKCIVIYFSQTGNTAKIAKAIGAGIKQVTGQCDLAPLKEINPAKLSEYDLIGLGSPVMEIEPPNVTLFIKNMRFVGGKHLFSFSTHLDLGFCYFPSIIPKLTLRGLIVIGWQDWYGTCYQYPSPTPYLTDGHPDEIDLQEAEEFGRQMAWRSQKISVGQTYLIPVPPAPVTFPDKEDQILDPLEKDTLPQFDQTKCVYPKCRLCMDHCPMFGIDLTVNPPVVAKPCMRYPCRFCALICPTGAIYIDDQAMSLLSRHIVKIIRQAGPQALREAELQGHFRRLIPVESVGWDNPVFKAYKPPRFIIGKGWNCPSRQLE